MTTRPAPAGSLDSRLREPALRLTLIRSVLGYSPREWDPADPIGTISTNQGFAGLVTLEPSGSHSRRG
jgi:hypothetical protein